MLPCKEKTKITVKINCPATTRVCCPATDRKKNNKIAVIGTL
jgi:hypothetical protein